MSAFEVFNGVLPETQWVRVDAPAQGGLVVKVSDARDVEITGAFTVEEIYSALAAIQEPGSTLELRGDQMVTITDRHGA